MPALGLRALPLTEREQPDRPPDFEGNPGADAVLDECGLGLPYPRPRHRDALRR